MSSPPIPLARDAFTKGWGVAHPLAGIRLTPGMVMIFGVPVGETSVASSSRL